MSDILKVTTPIRTQEAQNQQRQGTVKTQVPQVQGQVDTQRVVKPDARSDAASQENINTRFGYETNYSTFVQRLNDLNMMGEDFSKLFFERYVTLASSGLTSGHAAAVAEFLEMISMQSSQLSVFLKEQLSANTKFSGAFFTMLNQVLQNTDSVELRTGILDFLRKYSDMTQSQHTQNNIDSLLNSIKNKMFFNSKYELENLAEGLKNSSEQESLSLLKSKILPFLNKYISSINERGSLRDDTALLASEIAKLENGLAQRVLESFEYLMRFQGMQNAFKDMDTSLLLQVLKNTDYEKAKKNQKWADGLIQTIKEGVESSEQEKAVYENLMEAILLNESVYMPVSHLMLPMQIDGQLTFSQMWIDPDAQKENSQANKATKAVQALIKFDIEALGFFDMFFIYDDSEVKMQITVPEALGEDTQKIKEDISKIFANNGINAKEMFIDTNQPSIPVSEAFPKIFERKNSINVSI